MTAQIFKLATERPCRALDKALAAGEAAVTEAESDLAQLRDRIGELGIDPRAMTLLIVLQRHFAGCDQIMAELDYLKSLLRTSGRRGEHNSPS